MEVARNLSGEYSDEEDGKNSVSSFPMTRSKAMKKVPPKMVTPDKKKKADGIKIEREDEDDVPRKVRKIFKSSTTMCSIDNRAWQIRGKKLGGGLLCFYIQKSIRSGLKEQPYLRTLMYKIENDKVFREEELGIVYIGRRRNMDGTPMFPTERKIEFTYWYVFVAKEEFVESLEVWLSAVQDRLNEPDIAQSDLFKFKPTFAVTSWGQNEAGELLQHFLIDDDVVNFVIQEHNLLFPGNRDHLENVPLENYFCSTVQGVTVIKKYFAKNLV